MDRQGQVQVYEMSGRVRHFEIAFGGNGLARLYVETFEDAGGAAQSTSRLHVDGDIAEDVLRGIVEAVTRGVLASLPRGVCVVYKGHLVGSFDYGPPAPVPRA